MARVKPTSLSLSCYLQITAALADLAAAADAAPPGAGNEPSAASLAFVAAFGAFASLLVLPNSKALHKQLLAAMSRLPRAVFEPSMRELARRLADAAHRRLDGELADALSSIIAMQPAHELALTAMDCFVVVLVRALARGVVLAQAAVLGGVPTTPHAAECTHSALGVLYALVVRTGPHVLASPTAGAAEVEALSDIVDACLDCLQQPTLSRDVALTAAVTLTAGACLHLSAADAGALLANTLFTAHGAPAFVPDAPPPAACVLDTLVLQPRGRSLASEVSRCTPFGRLCMLKALVAAAPPEALLLPLHVLAADASDDQSTRNWTLLLDGVLPELCALAETTTCAHVRYHAVSGAASGVTRLATAVAACGADGRAPPCLPPALHARLMAVVWGGWEDPQPQVVKSVQTLFEAMLACDDVGRAPAVALDAALTLLRVGPRKGKYGPLTTLVRRARGSALLAAHPGLLFDTLLECEEETLCTAASGFLRALSEECVCPCLHACMPTTRSRAASD